MGNWIDVRERLPDEGQEVVVRYQGAYILSVFEQSEFWDDGMQFKIKATHWTPLPKDPTEDTDAT